MLMAATKYVSVYVCTKKRTLFLYKRENSQNRAWKICFMCKWGCLNAGLSQKYKCIVSIGET